MDIKMVKIDDIVPYENNPRHNADAIEPVKESIRQFGFKVPMILDKENVIVAGHTRYEAAKALGMTEVPVIYADDLTEEQIKAFRLIDNKTQELSEWDWAAVFEELELIDNINMELLGFREFLDESVGELKERKIKDGEEISIESFDDNEFSQECPCCGFRFNE